MATERGYSVPVVSCACVGKSLEFSLFRLNFSPQNSLNIPSFNIVLSLKLKKTCVVFLETFVNFLQA